MTPTATFPESEADRSIQVPSDPWLADWAVPTLAELEARHDSALRHQREGNIPSRPVLPVNPEVDEDWFAA